MPVAETDDLELGVPDGFTADEEMLQESAAVIPAGPPKPNKPIVGIIYPPPEVRSMNMKREKLIFCK